MMTQQPGFSILSAPLAAVDRRALSQAWYSALHLAREGRTAAPVRPAATQSACAVPPREHRASAIRTERPRNDNAHATHASRRSSFDGAGVSADRRGVRSALARKIEHTFLDPTRHVARTTFSVDGTRERVHVSLQTTGNRVRLVAVCSPSLRAAVAEALAQARYALAARGIEVAIC